VEISDSEEIKEENIAKSPNQKSKEEPPKVVSKFVNEGSVQEIGLEKFEEAKITEQEDRQISHESQTMKVQDILHT
jgi:hypothetical protein